MKTFEEYGIKIPSIYLPKNKDNLKTWSVIACDQYTQDKEYWKKVEDFTNTKPSTLKITLPEVYLSDSNKPERIKNIKKTMKEYLASDVLQELPQGMMYIERTTGYGRTRKGLVTAIDLETYDWKPFTTSLIRATEATILDRIPPRMEIRRDAPIETPHIMLLVNDKNGCLVDTIGKDAKKNIPTYDTDLMLNSGHISGWLVNSEKQLEIAEEALKNLAKTQKQKDNSVFLFAVGDGNHSLATAKAVWDEFKTNNGGIKQADNTISIPKGLENHNARFALIEIVNIYDEGLTFEPIHRVLFDICTKDLIEFVCSKLSGSITDFTTAEELTNDVSSSKNHFGFVFSENSKVQYKCLRTNIEGLAVSKLQPVLDEFLANVKADTKTQIDYIHGTDEVFRLGEKDGATSILLPPIEKESFFSTIANSGPLPRKSFSMGEASEKRFYMECRKLFN